MRRVVLFTAGICLLAPTGALAQGGSAPIVIDAQVPANPAETAPAVAQPAAVAPAAQPAPAAPDQAVSPAPGAQAGVPAPPPTATSVPGSAPAPVLVAPRPVESSPLVITGAPASPYVIVPPGGVRAAFPYGQYPYGAYGTAYTYAPPALPEDNPARIAASWQRRFAILASFGIGSPLGVLGAAIEYNFGPVIGASVGAGVGGWFGPAIAFEGYVRPIRWGRWAPFLGVGYSFNFTPGQYTDPNSGLNASSLSHWLNAEIGMEYRSFRGVLFRFGLGNALLMNTGDFTNVDFTPSAFGAGPSGCFSAASHYGPCSNHSVGFDPVTAADAHDEGHVLDFAYFHLDLGYTFE
jgi:hypothetical protein